MEMAMIKRYLKPVTKTQYSVNPPTTSPSRLKAKAKLLCLADLKEMAKMQPARNMGTEKKSEEKRSLGQNESDRKRSKGKK